MPITPVRALRPLSSRDNASRSYVRAHAAIDVNYGDGIANSTTHRHSGGNPQSGTATGAGAGTHAAVALGTRAGNPAAAARLNVSLGTGISPAAVTGISTGANVALGTGTGAGPGSTTGAGSGNNSGLGSGSNMGSGSSGSSASSGGSSSSGSPASRSGSAFGQQLRIKQCLGFQHWFRVRQYKHEFGLGSGLFKRSGTDDGCACRFERCCNERSNRLADDDLPPFSARGRSAATLLASNTICLTAKEHPADVCQVSLRIAGF